MSADCTFLGLSEALVQELSHKWVICAATGPYRRMLTRMAEYRHGQAGAKNVRGCSGYVWVSVHVLFLSGIFHGSGDLEDGNIWFWNLRIAEMVRKMFCLR